MGSTEQALIKYATALRVSATEEASELAWQDFLASLHGDLRTLLDRDDLGWVREMLHEGFASGWTSALHRASVLGLRALEEVA